MAWSVNYNGFSAWTNLTIESIRYEPVREDDGVTTRTMRGTLRGRGLLANTSAANLAADIASLVAAFDDQQASFLLSNGTVIVDIDPANPAKTSVSRGYPRGTVEVTEIAGTLTAFAVFEIEWETNPADTNEPDDIVSHSWQQRFNIDESGMTTWSVTGTLYVADNADGTPDPSVVPNSPEQGPEPDVYRRLVFPVIPENFRVQAMEWAESPEGNRLLYNIVAREHARPLPSPARRGTGSFQWRRAIDTGDILGVKTFEGSLTGDASSDRGSLLAALLNVAARRITFAGPGADQILGIEVTEDDVFSSNTVGLRIRARGVGTVTGNPLGTGFRILDSLVAPADYATQIDPYGSALIRFVKRGIFGGDYTGLTFPKAETVGVPASLGGEVAYTVTEEAITAAFSTVVPPGQLAGLNDAQAQHSAYPYLRATVKERVYTRSNVLVLKEQSIGGRDYPYQTQTPDLFLETEYEIVRQGEPAESNFLRAPANCIVLEEGITVVPSEIDANNTRSYTTVLRRRLQLLRTPGSASFFVTDDATIGPFTFTLQRAVIPAVAIGADPRRETSAQSAIRTLFEAPTTAGDTDSIVPFTGTPHFQAPFVPPPGP